MQDENYRNQLIDQAAAAYAQGVIDQPGFETLVTRINSLDDRLELVSLANNLPAVFSGRLVAASNQNPIALLWQEMAVTSGNLRKTGEWVRADGYQIDARSSNVVLNFLAYDGVSGFRLALDINLFSSNLRLEVPDNWLVDISIDDNIASNIKDKGSKASWGDNRIVVRGALKSSNIKVKYK